jgi:ABC-type transporter Mla MlaB component
MARTGAFAFTITGPIEREDVEGLSRRVCRLLGERPGVGNVWCEVAGVPADAVTVDALARLQLGARRHGCVVRLRGASEELRALVELMGLTDVLCAG